MQHIAKRMLSVALAAALAAGLVGTSFASAAGSADDPSKYEGSLNVTQYDYPVYETDDKGNSYPCYWWGADDEFPYIYTASVYDSARGNYENLYCLQEHETDWTTRLKAVNPNATESQIKSYFNSQLSKGNIQKLTVAVWDQDDTLEGSGYGMGTVEVTTSGKTSDKYYPDAHTSELISGLNGLVDFVPDGTYEWTDLCQMCDVIVCPYACSTIELFYAEYYNTETLLLYNEDPRIFTYYDFEDTSSAITVAEAFAIMYGNPCYKYWDGNDFYVSSVRSLMCQMNNMDADGTVILDAGICYGHNYELQSSTLNGSNAVMTVKCTRCGDTEQITNCDISILSKQDATCTSDGYENCKISGSYTYTALSGNSRTSSFEDTKTVTLPATGHVYISEANHISVRPIAVTDGTDGIRQTIVDCALDMVGVPYLVGGRGDSLWPQAVNTTGSDFVFDCAGLTQYVYLHALEDNYGISISFSEDSESRWAVATQWNFAGSYAIGMTDSISSFIAQLEPGDLIFFNEQADGTPGHVGIYIGNGQMVDANSNPNIMQVTVENLYTDRDKDSIMGARRIIFGVGETYPATMDLCCGGCGSEVTIDATAELTGGYSATCGQRGCAAFIVSGDYGGQTYTAATELFSDSTTGHNWDYEHVKIEYVDPRYGNQVIVTCKNCGATQSFDATPSYSVQMLSWNDAEGEYEYPIMTLSLMIVGDDGQEYAYVIETTEGLGDMNTAHEWEKVDGIGSDPTCTRSGSRQYICTDCGATKTEFYDPLGHDWSVTDAQWSDDYSECVLAFECRRCGETTEESAVVTMDTIDDTIVYTATVVLDGETYSATETVQEAEVSEPVKNPDDGGNTEEPADSDEETAVGTDAEETASEGSDNTVETISSNSSSAGSSSAAVSDTAASPTVTNTVVTAQETSGNASENSASVSESAGTTATDNVKTGDMMPVLLLICACGITGLIAAAGCRRRKRTD